MSALNSILQSLDDRMNPIVVKELRQAVAGRFVASVLLLFLVVQLLVLGAFLLGYEGAAGDMDAGRQIFGWLQSIMLGTCLLFIPAYAAMRLNAERSGEHTDLLFVTTLKPRAIIWGKFLSAVLIAVLIYTACMPFLTLTYLLRGIDLPTIFLLLGVGFVVVAAAIMFALFLACIPANRVMKSLLGLGGLSALIWTYGIMVAFSAATSSGILSSWGSLMELGGTLFAIAAVAGLLYVLSVAMVSPPSANRALPVRAYLMAAWLATGAFCFGWAMVQGIDWPPIPWMVCSVMLLCVALLAAVSERDEPGPRLLRTIPRNRLLRPLAFLLYSGSAGGACWTLGMIAATLGAGYAWREWGVVSSLSADPDTALRIFTQLALYATAYALTALLLRRTLLKSAITTSNTYALALILMGLGTIVPFIVALITSTQPYNMVETVWFVTVPFMVLDGNRTADIWWWVPSIWAAWAVAMNLPWLITRYHAFRRPSGTEKPQRHREHREEAEGEGGGGGGDDVVADAAAGT